MIYQYQCKHKCRTPKSNRFQFRFPLQLCHSICFFYFNHFFSHNKKSHLPCSLYNEIDWYDLVSDNKQLSHDRCLLFQFIIYNSIWNWYHLSFDLIEFHFQFIDYIYIPLQSSRTSLQPPTFCYFKQPFFTFNSSWFDINDRSDING